MTQFPSETSHENYHHKFEMLDCVSKLEEIIQSFLLKNTAQPVFKLPTSCFLLVDLKRTNPRGDTQKWSCDGYWSRTTIYAKEGPVPDYVTLTGNGREVEIGSFLSQDERKSLYEELQKELTNYKSINQRNH